MHCTLVYRLYIMARLKWQQKCANAADRGDRVESVYTRVYSIIYSSSISVQFVGVQVFLLRVNHDCKTNTSMTVDNNLDKPLEAVVVEQSRLPVVHCSSLTGLLESWSVACSSIVGLGVALSLVHRWSIAGASLVFQLVHRWSICWCIAHPSVPLSLVHRASLWLLLCPSCIADASLMRR